MKATLVVSLDEDNAAFLEALRQRTEKNADPNELINRLLHAEAKRVGISGKGKSPDVHSTETKAMQHFIDEQIPSAG